MLNLIYTRKNPVTLLMCRPVRQKCRCSETPAKSEAMDHFSRLPDWFVGYWILTSCQPYWVTSGQSKSVVCKCTFQNSSATHTLNVSTSTAKVQRQRNTCKKPSDGSLFWATGLVCWLLDFNVLSTVLGHLRTVQVRRMQMHISKLFSSFLKSNPQNNPYASLKKCIVLHKHKTQIPQELVP